MSEPPGRDQSATLIWLRIGVAAVVVVGLVVLTAALDDSDSGFEALDGRSASDSVTRCGDSEARRVARAWFRGMSSGEAKRVEAVTSSGAPVPRYVISIERGGEDRTLRIRTRASAARTVPGLTDSEDDLRLLEIRRVVKPPKASDTGSGLSGRLAGVEFAARVAGAAWSGKVGVRCGSDTAYFAAFRITGD